MKAKTTGESWQVLDDEEEVIAIMQDEKYTVAQNVVQKTKLPDRRNAQLSKLIQHIVSFVLYTEADDIDQHLNWS